jgi:hypothetical protein
MLSCHPKSSLWIVRDRVACGPLAGLWLSKVDIRPVLTRFGLALELQQTFGQLWVLHKIRQE